MYHLVRLADECSQILTLGDLDLQRAKEHMKAVRRGEVPLVDIEDWFAEKEKTLEKEYAESKLPHGPRMAEIKALLLNCIEQHYGSLSAAEFAQPDALQIALRQIEDIAARAIRRRQ